jgi:hypothetical protein
MRMPHSNSATAPTMLIRNPVAEMAKLPCRKRQYNRRVPEKKRVCSQKR